MHRISIWLWKKIYNFNELKLRRALKALWILLYSFQTRYVSARFMHTQIHMEKHALWAQYMTFQLRFYGKLLASCVPFMHYLYNKNEYKTKTGPSKKKKNRASLTQARLEWNFSKLETEKGNEWEKNECSNDVDLSSFPWHFEFIFICVSKFPIPRHHRTSPFQDEESTSIISWPLVKFTLVCCLCCWHQHYFSNYIHYVAKKMLFKRNHLWIFLPISFYPSLFSVSHTHKHRWKSMAYSQSTHI